LVQLDELTGYSASSNKTSTLSARVSIFSKGFSVAITHDHENDLDLSGRSRVSDADRVRMTGHERRAQLVEVGRMLFAEKGFESVTVEEIANTANVSKPVVYEHFGSKDGLYAVVVDREMTYLLNSITQALTAAHPRLLLEQTACALFDYIESNTDGFRILLRDSPAASSSTTPTGSFASLLSDVAQRVEELLSKEFKIRGFPFQMAPMYAHMFVGMVALTGQWWLDERDTPKDEVIAHLVNLVWNGAVGLESDPRLISRRIES
jgi:AcrR family transcriptional regulator